MKKIDKTVKRETLFVLAGSVILSALMESVFLIIGKWNLPVLFGNLLGVGFSVLNFLLMGITVQGSIGKDEKAIRTRVRFSIVFRELMLLGIAVGAYFLPSVFNIIAYLISLFFPRITIMARPRFKLSGDEDDVISADAPTGEENEENEDEEA